MLFDLRGRGRRRTVKVIYVGLALLFGVGFVGFGVGVGGGGGGLFDAFSNSNGTSSASFASQIKKDRKLVAKEPTRPAPVMALIQDLLRQAGTGENYNNTTSEGTFTPKASGLLHEARQNWQRYLVLEPKHPNADLANQMLQVFSGPGGLNEPAEAVAAMQIVIAGRPPSVALYATLAQLSYKAGNTREGDLASQKAIALAPKAQRQQLRTELAEIKKNPSGEEGAAAAAQTTTVQSTTAAGGVGGIGVNPNKTQTTSTSTGKTSTTAPAKH